MTAHEYLTVLCRGCGKPIEDNQVLGSVGLQVWIPSLNRWAHEGPFHPECAKSFKTTEGTT